MSLKPKHFIIGAWLAFSVALVAYLVEPAPVPVDTRYYLVHLQQELAKPELSEDQRTQLQGDLTRFQALPQNFQAEINQNWAPYDPKTQREAGLERKRMLDEAQAALCWNNPDRC